MKSCTGTYNIPWLQQNPIKTVTKKPRGTHKMATLGINPELPAPVRGGTFGISNGWENSKGFLSTAPPMNRDPAKTCTCLSVAPAPSPCGHRGGVLSRSSSNPDLRRYPGSDSQTFSKHATPRTRYICFHATRHCI